MPEKLIVIVETDERYLSALEYKFASEWGETVQIEGISSLKYLNEYFEEPRSIYLMVINEYLYSDRIARHDCRHVFLLTEEENAVREQENVQRVFKYTGIEEIYGKISRQLQHNRDRRRGERVNVTAVCSVSGGCGKTLFSLGLASELASGEQNVLYLSAEALQDFQVYLKEEVWLDDVFCHSLVMHEERIGAMAKERAVSEEFFYLPPLRRSSVSYQIRPSDYAFLIERLIQCRFWQEIVVELPQNLDDGMTQLLEKADHVVVLCRQDGSSAARLRAFLQSISVRDEKYLFVCGRYDASKENSLIADTQTEPAEYIEEFSEKELTPAAFREKGILHNLAYMLD